MAAHPLKLPALLADDQVLGAFAAGVGEALAPAEDKLEHLAGVLDPWLAPPALLDWLVLITRARVEPGWDERQLRTAIALAPWLEAHRGTPAALLREAREIHQWDLAIDESGGGVHRDGDPFLPISPTLTVTMTAREGEDLRSLELQLARLVLSHCPAHLPFKSEVKQAG